MQDERNISKLGSEKLSLNGEVGPQGGDKDAPKAQVALAPGGSWWLLVFGRRYGGRPAEGGGGKLPVRPRLWTWISNAGSRAAD